MHARCLFVALSLTSSLPTFASDTMPVKDMVKGAMDHAVVSRFDGAKIVGYDVKAFDDASLIAGKVTGAKDKVATFEKTLQQQGKRTRIAYNYPADRSGLEVSSNYAAALQKAGLKTLFACAR